MTVVELTKAEIQRFHQSVADGKTAMDVRTKARGRAIVKGGKGTANRTIDLLSSILAYSMELNVATKNPALGIKKFTLKKHDRYLSVEELERLGEALKSVEAEGASLFTIAAIRLLALSGCRRSEALTLQWAWLDFQHNIAKLPDSKTGQKALLLGEEAASFLKTLPRVDGSPLVFPSAVGGATPLSIQKIWAKVRNRAELSDLRLHDLRHNFASAAVSSGQSLYVVERLLGHTQSQTTQRYAHLAPDPIRLAANEVAAEIAQKLNSA